jgi:hypothetical protein
MGVRCSLPWIVGACLLSFSCGDSGKDPGSGLGGSGGGGGREASAGSSHGGANQSGSANQAGGAHGGALPMAGASPDYAGQAGNAEGGSSDGGAAAEAGAAGAPEPASRFEPWALWPMPNAASSGLPHPANYDASSPGVVLDKVTGLIWQASAPAGTYAWSGAQAYCAGLVLAGFKDWRLPARIELISIVDYSVAKPGPVIDTVAFPGAPNTLFWSASTQAGYGTTRAWYVEFDNGFAFTDSTNTAYGVRCVR